MLYDAVCDNLLAIANSLVLVFILDLCSAFICLYPFYKAKLLKSKACVAISVFITVVAVHRQWESYHLHTKHELIAIIFKNHDDYKINHPAALQVILNADFKLIALRVHSVTW